MTFSGGWRWSARSDKSIKPWAGDGRAGSPSWQDQLARYQGPGVTASGYFGVARHLRCVRDTMRALGCTSRVASQTVAKLSHDIKCVSRGVPILVCSFSLFTLLCSILLIAMRLYNGVSNKKRYYKVCDELFNGKELPA